MKPALPFLCVLAVLSVAANGPAEAGPFLDAKPAGDPAAGIARPAMPMTRESMRAFRDKEFDITDTNHDGVLDIGEIKARLVAATGTWSPDRLAMGFRHNCGFDGDRCTREQFRQAGYATFDRADANHDGKLTLDEMKADRLRTEQPY